MISFGLPIGCYAFAFLCNDVSGCPAPSLLSPTRLFESGLSNALSTLSKEVGWPGFAGLINAEAVLGTVAWYVISLLLYILLPAEEVDGTELRSGGRLRYRFNGNRHRNHPREMSRTDNKTAFLTAATILTTLAAGSIVSGPKFAVWTFIDRNYIQLLTCNIIIAYALATWVYIRSFSVKAGNPEQRELAAGGHSGNIIYDWYIGRELNPRCKIPLLGTEIDIKSFMELRPGMIGWMVLDFAWMAKQYGSYGYVTDSMLMVTISQSLYILDALFNESAILTTMDLTTDGFGFMLSFGDLVWVPFVYTIQARYLSVHPIVLGPFYVAAILAVQGIGYYIFRASNNEKNRFRTDPADPRVAHLEFIETASGSKLLTSGWWGTARHINYLGDWVMSWAYCLPTLAAGYKLTNSLLWPGTRIVTVEGMKWWGTPITYFYMLYFAILLIHREGRDEAKCKRKYGKDWERYCEKVRWRILPGIY